MPQRRPPAYCRHKPTGQARVRMHGKDHYLGPYGSPESHRRYAAIMDDWYRRQAAPPVETSVGELSVLYLQHAKRHYRKHGKPTSEVGCIRDALKSSQSLVSKSSWQWNWLPERSSRSERA